MLSLVSFMGKDSSSMFENADHKAIVIKPLMLVGSGADVSAKNTAYPKDMMKAPKNAFFIKTSCFPSSIYFSMC